MREKGTLAKQIISLRLVFSFEKAKNQRSRDVYGHEGQCDSDHRLHHAMLLTLQGKSHNIKDDYDDKDVLDAFLQLAVITQAQHADLLKELEALQKNKDGSPNSQLEGSKSSSPKARVT